MLFIAVEALLDHFPCLREHIYITVNKIKSHVLADQVHPLCNQLNAIPPQQVKKRKSLVSTLLQTQVQVFLESPFSCIHGTNIHTDHGLYANHHVAIEDFATVTFGRNVLIGPHCVITTQQQNSDAFVPVTIGHGVWIGAHCVIHAGVNIGENTVIGAGSTVTTSLPANAVAFGNPAKVIRFLDKPDTDS